MQLILWEKKKCMYNKMKCYVQVNFLSIIAEIIVVVMSQSVFFFFTPLKPFLPSNYFLFFAQSFWRFCSDRPGLGLCDSHCDIHLSILHVQEESKPAEQKRSEEYNYSIRTLTKNLYLHVLFFFVWCCCYSTALCWIVFVVFSFLLTASSQDGKELVYAQVTHIPMDRTRPGTCNTLYGYI